MKDVKSWIEKTRTALDSPQNKKRPLRDQLALREKMLADITIQRTKISISVEKLQVLLYSPQLVDLFEVCFFPQVHFRSGVGGDFRVTAAAEELLKELDQVLAVVKEQHNTLEGCLAQVEQYQQEVQQLRQQIVHVEQQLRTVLAPTYSPHDREKALEDQQVRFSFPHSRVCSVDEPSQTVHVVNRPLSSKKRKR